MIPRLVLFDCDGVLVDSEPITNKIMQANFAKRGLDLDMDQINATFVGGTMATAGKQAAQMGANINDDWVDEIYAEIFAGLAKGTPLIKGIENVLDQLDAAGIPYGVGSNGSFEKMEITLGQHPQIQQRLSGRIFSAHVHAKPKPAPDLYLFAAKAMGVDPRHCVVVDDSPSGCTAAVKAGIICHGFAEHDDGARLATVGARVFHQMANLPRILGLPG